MPIDKSMFLNKLPSVYLKSQYGICQEYNKNLNNKDDFIYLLVNDKDTYRFDCTTKKINENSYDVIFFIDDYISDKILNSFDPLFEDSDIKSY